MLCLCKILLKKFKLFFNIIFILLSASDTIAPSAKRISFSKSINNSDSTQPSIISVKSVNEQHDKSSLKNMVQSTPPPIPISQIKKEKIDKPKVMTQVKTVTMVTPPAPSVQPVTTESQIAAPSADEPVVFTCASCQFQTKDETEFMKHARTDHRSDLSMWCKLCGKCFSNAGVLVSHIKERACIKEEMIYRCGVKDCIFETTSGQTFVHHLRHCHKGSPFIFCVHCQKIFTLPHCLILHMQDDCPFKEKNRRNPSAVASTATATPKTNSTAALTPQSVTPVAALRAPTPNITYNPKPIAPKPTPTIISQVSQPVRTPIPMPVLSTPNRGRGRGGRGRGRGRGRIRISDSSDSDDPDDPSWHPEETLGETGLRRSGRWAKKINDVMNPEPSTSGVSSSAKKSFTSAELNTKMINCPCCDFMAAFQSVLEDHYIANHKVPNKNACLVCHLKFENTRSFHDHFEEHRKGALPNKSPFELINENSNKVVQQKEVDTSANANTVAKNAEHVSTENSVQSDSKQASDYILTRIPDAESNDANVAEDRPAKIPYQSAIHDKNLKDSKLKKFEELKSPNDLITMKTIQKLRDFFKCGVYNCSFTTNVMDEFLKHLGTLHSGKRFYCCYCLKEDFSHINITNHIILEHSKRTYQCSKCFFRAYSKNHIQIHIKNSHAQDTATDILKCDPHQIPDDIQTKDPVTTEVETTWPYVCGVRGCSYKTNNPKEFKKHNETSHRTVSSFICHYCTVEFLTFKRLMNHYRLHGLNTFQCKYCIHGAETKEEILLHLSNAHADFPLKAFIRGSEEEVAAEESQLNSVVQEDSNDSSVVEKSLTEKSMFIENLSAHSQKENVFTGCENELYHVIDNVCYPKHLFHMCYPRYTQNLISNLVCGIPFCKERFETMPMYVTHLRNVHDSLNFPCPHCPEMCNTWEDFKNHLLCHASKLYTCGSKDCEFYDWNKDRVKEHKKGHQDSENGVVAVREFASGGEEESKVNALQINCLIPNPVTTYVCLFCKYKSADQNIMKNHIYKELAYIRFKCRLCDKKYLSRKNIKDHYISSHPGLDIICSTDINVEVEAIVKIALKKQDIFKDAKIAELCDMCCKKFKDPMRLQSHLYICLQKEYRPYKCNHCKKSSVNLLALRYHTEEEHCPQPIEFTVDNNYAIEDDIEKNLFKIRLKQLKDIFEENKLEIDDSDDNFSKFKFYTCSVCPFEADHKFSIQKHIKEQHSEEGVVIKAKRNLNSVNLNSQFDENSNDGVSSKSSIKRYSCGFCVKKMYTIQETENHVKSVHPVKNAEEYFYYYSPDVSIHFSPDDKDMFECAYCKSKENLFALKKHADLLHAEMEFKVKGYVSRVQSHNYLACGYCYLKVENHVELQRHSATTHPLLALKSIGDFLPPKAKRSIESTDDIPNKRIKFASSVFVCSHCGGAFSSEEHINAHSRKAHSRLKGEFQKIDQTSNSGDSTDIKFYKCEFCKFTSERQFLDKHLATKHKMRVTCFYCSKRFEFASKLKEHHDIAHKDSPLKYSQETINIATIPSNDLHQSAMDDTSNESKSDVIPMEFSYYGKEPEPIDLTSLTVHMATKEGQSAKLPLVYVTELFDIFPKVFVKDCMKEKPCE